MITQEIVSAVRADTEVGVGTCSVVDECYTDLELLEALDYARCYTVHDAVNWARNMERLFREHEQEIRAEIF